MNRYVELYRKTHRGEGLCVDCPEKAVIGKIRCQKHLDYQAEQVKERRRLMHEAKQMAKQE